MTKKQVLSFLIFLISAYTPILFANPNAATWKGTYYQAIPVKSSISQKYCDEHTPGTFIHVVNDVLAHGTTTDRGIKLDHASFHQEQKRGIYFIKGDLMASGKSGSTSWEDHIYYYLYKLTELGETRGVWSTDECKGLYLGIAANSKTSGIAI